MMSAAPNFANPPIVEFILGAQFFPLTKLTAGHFGRFWDELGDDDWRDPADSLSIEDQFELFDRPRWAAPIPQLRIEPIRIPGRFTLGHKDKGRLLQLQPTRFHLNWRKRENFYPSYKKLIVEFEELFGRFSAFAERNGLGTLAVNQWELTYIDAFMKDGWNSPSDWPRILPGLFGPLFPTEGLEIALEHRAAEWSYEIGQKLGRLHIAAGPGRAGEDNREALLLQMTSRGPVGKEGVKTLRSGLDLGHEAAVGAFRRVVSQEEQGKWGTIP
jgi:uncharacterized protein (TIGR04255 family)